MGISFNKSKYITEQNKTYYEHVCITGTYRAIILLLTTNYEIKRCYTHM